MAIIRQVQTTRTVTTSLRRDVVEKFVQDQLNPPLCHAGVVVPWLYEYGGARNFPWASRQRQTNYGGMYLRVCIMVGAEGHAKITRMLRDCLATDG